MFSRQQIETAREERRFLCDPCPNVKSRTVSAGSKQKSYKIMRRNKAKRDIENIRGLNLTAVKLPIVQVTKLPM
jgi:hypothetical protein